MVVAEWPDMGVGSYIFQIPRLSTCSGSGNDLSFTMVKLGSGTKSARSSLATRIKVIAITQATCRVSYFKEALWMGSDVNFRSPARTRFCFLFGGGIASKAYNRFPSRNLLINE